jgi:hypothetical protein
MLKAGKIVGERHQNARCAEAKALGKNAQWLDDRIRSAAHAAI